ncbi:hypothetical protein GGR28_000987 [Lewinella aquimaris]|uniref:Uncharacterized protein n=1 Tax=Neolewinella aquimaris TaxID=1835722 RepID=A0A840DYN6_9BACT|nr:hypothetical protein [Neolewinella aquimaris]
MGIRQRQAVLTLAGVLAVALLVYGMAKSEIDHENIIGSHGSGYIASYQISTALPLGIFGLVVVALAYRFGSARG